MSNIELKGLRGLKGLDHLLRDNQRVNFKYEKLQLLPIDLLQSGKYQPRSNFDDTALAELAVSIKSSGIIQPLIVRQLSATNTYEIIAGERRWRAAKIAMMTEVPVIVREISDQTALAFGLIENIQRENLTAIDEALAIDRLINEFELTHEQVAEAIGRSRSTVTNLLRLLSLDDDIKVLLQQNLLEMGHARALVGLSNHDQKRLSQQIITKNLSVRVAEKLVYQHNNRTVKPGKFSNPDHEEQIKIWQRLLQQKISSKVDIHISDAKGKVVFHCASLAEIDKLIKKIIRD